jgi:hypothetical protein
MIKQESAATQLIVVQNWVEEVMEATGGGG